MIIYQVEQDYGDYTLIISEDVNKILDRIGAFNNNTKISIWEDGKVIKTIDYEYKEPTWDNVYIDLMSGV